MKSLGIFLVFALLMALAITHLSATPSDQELEHSTFPNSSDFEPEGSLRGRFLGQKKTRPGLTCNKYPKLCQVKGSPGPNCCKKKCVNVQTDRLNCGKCGHKCKYSHICCNGKCVNPMSDKKHCGGCGNNCNKGNKCLYGMCSYA